MTRERELEIIELIKREVKPALGCTEPVAVSLAVAKAAEALREIGVEPVKVEIAVSGNILKNGMGVGVPGTGMVGLHIAAALGVTCGVSGYRLEVLKDLNKTSIDNAKKMLEDKLVSVSIAETDKKLYISAECTSGTHSSIAIIEDNHDNITQVIRDNKVIYMSGSHGSENENANNENREINDYKLTVKNIVKFSKSVPFEDIAFILDSVTLNRALSDEGLENNYGLKVGKTIKDNIHKNVFGDGLLTHSMAITAAASDARMAGCTLPAMSNSGSGNQ
ncbi:MAG: L-serine ammonia-lyase, iron-sulfur-dependent, subunit alpha, partial [Bacteroidales bacterium]|nr:L-serine ammonia-lyase, iron-sulfur-dependent, subunit alpha [Bacteroidales bacterium]